MCLTVAAVGDVAIIGRAAARVRALGPAWLLDSARPTLAGADLVLFNLEMPFAPADAERPAHVPEAFRVDPSLAAALDFGRPGVACLANNHVTDFGDSGLRATLATLNAAGIPHVGAGFTDAEARRPLEIEAGGRRVGVLAYAAEGPHSVGARGGAAVARRKDILEDLARLRPRVDVVTVVLHTGLTYLDLPSPRERELRREIARSGADLVLCHHPHVLQGVEPVDRSVVAHSLGEFVFDPSVGNVRAKHALERRRHTAVLLARCVAGGVRDWELVPMRVSEDGRPEPAGALEASLRERSSELARLLGRDDYANVYNENASRNLVGHETRVLLSAIRRADLGYLGGKLLRIRPRHVGLLLRWLGRRLRPGRPR